MNNITGLTSVYASVSASGADHSNIRNKRERERELKGACTRQTSAKNPNTIS